MELISDGLKNQKEESVFIINKNIRESMSTIEKLSKILGEQYIPVDSGDYSWENDSETFTRKEVAHLLWTQIAMISNDLKRNCGNELSETAFEIIKNPRIPKF